MPQKYDNQNAVEHQLKTIEGHDWIMRANEHQSKHAKCPLCESKHYLHFYTQSKCITYYYCKPLRKWVNDYLFMDF